MRIYLFSLIFLLIANFAAAGERDRGERPLTEGFYLNIGMVQGPDFSSFFNYVNDTYSQQYLNDTERFKKFDKSAALGLGYLLRLYPSFALDIGFSVYSLKRKGQITNLNPSFPEAGIRHDLEYQVGIFSATIPVLLDFSPKQPIVPYAGIGFSIFAMRLDDIKDDGFIVTGYSDNGTSVGGQFEAGMYVKVTKKIWIDFKGKWNTGTGYIRAQEPQDQYDKFKIEQDISQISVGGVYFFR